jgi:cation transport regulator
MPYQSTADLPDSVKDNLPEHAQEIYKEAFNSALEEYQARKNVEEIASKVAWSAVKNSYHKNKDGQWVKSA